MYTTVPGKELLAVVILFPDHNCDIETLKAEEVGRYHGNASFYLRHRVIGAEKMNTNSRDPSIHNVPRETHSVKLRLLPHSNAPGHRPSFLIGPSASTCLFRGPHLFNKHRHVADFYDQHGLGVYFTDSLLSVALSNHLPRLCFYASVSSTCSGMDAATLAALHSLVCISGATQPYRIEKRTKLFLISGPNLSFHFTLNDITLFSCLGKDTGNRT